MSLSRYRAVLCDLDGCLIAGDRVLPGARSFVEHLGERLMLLSNNSTDIPETLSARLAGMGLAIPAGRILLAGTEALALLAARPGMRLRLYGSALLAKEAHRLGLDPAAQAPTHLLLTRDTAFTYADLQDVVRAAAQGAVMVVANPDTSHPGTDGLPVPETGAILAAVCAAVPQARIEIMGKPGPLLYRRALRRIGCGPGDVLAVGDNPLTDGGGADSAGIAVRIVRTGSEDLSDMIAGRCAAIGR